MAVASKLFENNRFGAACKSAMLPGHGIPCGKHVVNMVYMIHSDVSDPVGEVVAPLLPFPPGCVIGYFLRREKRFSVAVALDPDCSQIVWAHTNNTGSMLGLLRPGAPVLLSPALGRKRKLAWTLELIRADWRCQQTDGKERGFWTGINTSVPNRLLEAAFRAGRLPWARGYTRLIREQVCGDSRFDALFEGPDLPPLWVECKNVTLVEDDIALFPDAVSMRGTRHLYTLSEMARSGNRAAMFYLVQRPDGRCFGPADMIDPDYAEAFALARQNGVEIYPHEAVLSLNGIDFHELCLKINGKE